MISTSFARKRKIPLGAGLAAAACLLAAVSCAGKARDRVMILGVDGLDWEMVDALRARGGLPNLDRLIKTGVSARIVTNDAGGSAVFWTSIATGQTSAKHGIRGFVSKDRASGAISPVTSNQRITKAFWNILSERGIPVGVTGWYVTWPAEKVDGFMVSSYFTWTDVQPTAKGTFYPKGPDMVYPPSLAERTQEDVERGLAEYRKIIDGIFRARPTHTHRPKVVKTQWSVMSDCIYAEVGRDLRRRLKPRVFALYLGGVDVVGHFFSKETEAEARLSERNFGPVQPNYYRAVDALLSPYLAEADKGTDIILVSDHGLMRGQHTDNGVCVLAGPHFRDGVRLDDPVKLTDICPTLLYLVGLPAAEDMDGRVCLEAVEPEFVRSHRVRTIASYGKRKGVSREPLKSDFDRDILERLRTLGYLK